MGDPRIVRGLIGEANEWRWRRRASDARGNEPVGIAAHLLRRRHRAGNAGLTRPRSGVADCEDVGMARQQEYMPHGMCFLIDGNLRCLQKAGSTSTPLTSVLILLECNGSTGFHGGFPPRR